MRRTRRTLIATPGRQPGSGGIFIDLSEEGVADGVAQPTDIAVVLSSINVSLAPADGIADTVDPTVFTRFSQAHRLTTLSPGATPQPYNNPKASFETTLGDADSVAEVTDLGVELGSLAVDLTVVDAVAETDPLSVVLGDLVIDLGAVDALADTVDPVISLENVEIDLGSGDAVADTVDPTIALSSQVIDLGAVDAQAEVSPLTTFVSLPPEGLVIALPPADALTDGLPLDVIGGSLMLDLGGADANADLLDLDIALGVIYPYATVFIRSQPLCRVDLTDEALVDVVITDEFDGQSALDEFASSAAGAGRGRSDHMSVKRKYLLGSTERLRARFYEQGTNTPIDPGSVTFTVKSPAPVITQYVYGVDEEVVKEGTGVYYMDILFNETGTWCYRVDGTVPAPGAAEGALSIRKSCVL